MLPGHSSSAGPSPTGGSGHNTPPPHHIPPSSPPPDEQRGADISGPQPPAPPSVYPGYYPPYPYPPPVPGQPYPPPFPQSGPFVPPPYPVLPPLFMPPPPPAQQSSLKPLWITLAVVITLVVVLCISCSVLFALSIAHIASEPTQITQVPAALEPVLAAQQFCDYETNKDYRGAYQQLSTNLRTGISEQQFESDNQTRDTTLGPVVGCSAARLSPAAGDSGTPESPTILTLDIWLGGSTTLNAPPNGRSGTITMVDEISGWKVEAVDSALMLT